MTVIYFLYLFTFIEMLPPRDLGSVMLRLQEIEPAGPLPHHLPPTTSLLHSTKESRHSQMGLGVRSDGNCFPSFPTPQQRDLLQLSRDPHPWEGFSGFVVGQPHCTQLWVAVGASGTESCGGEATGTLLGQGYGGISQSSCQQRTWGGGEGL